MKKIYVFSAALLMAVSMSAQLGYNVVYSESDYNNANTTVSNEGSNAWDGGLRLGKSSAGFNWDNKHVVIKLAAGIPDQLYFTYKKNNVTSTSSVGFRIRESADNVNFENVFQQDAPSASTSATSTNVSLKPTTRYISIEWHGNFSAVYSGIQVTPATTYDSVNFVCCASDSVEYLGHYYKPGRYPQKFTNYFGGDSIFTVVVEGIEKRTTLPLIEAAVGEEVTIFDADTIFQAPTDTTISIVLPSAEGCDSVVYQPVSIKYHALQYNMIYTEDDFLNPYITVSMDEASWDNGAVKLTNASAGFDWTARSVVIYLAEGTPDKLLCTTQQDNLASTGMGFRVRESADGVNFTNAAELGLTGTTATDQEIQLAETTRYISLDWGGNFSARYSNIMVTPTTPTTALPEKDAVATPVQKIMVNGKMYIISDGKMYDIMGNCVR